MTDVAKNRLYLIRHARPASTWGGDDPDPGLDAVGADQARAAADRLSALPVGERPTRVISSPLRRCRETAQPLADVLGVEVSIEPAFGEVPTPAAIPAEARGEWLRAAMAGRWDEMVGDLDYEAWRQAVLSAAAEHPGAAIFSHFVAINAAVSLILDDPRVLVFRPDHASITTIEVEAGSRELRLVARGAEANTGVL